MRLYRFALLLTGNENAAQQVLTNACADCAARLGSYRNAQSRIACILGNMRNRARALPAGEPQDSARPFAPFSTLQEEERAALAALYAGLLPASELAEALNMSLDQLGRVLKSGRERLNNAGHSGLELGEQNLEPAL